jgi:N utilization substance protein B
MSKRRKSRELALQGLYQIEISEERVKEVLSFDWVESKIDFEIADFTRMLINGTLKNIERIDSFISKYSLTWNISRISLLDKNLLRFSIFSLLYQPEIPATVIINEAVDIAKKFCEDDSYKFVNGILDEVNREVRRAKE